MTTLAATARHDLAAVLLEIAGAPAGAVIIRRTDANGTADVRLQLGQVPSAGSMVVYDYEPALQGTAAYTVIDSAAGTASASVDLDVAFPVLMAAVLPNRRASLTMVDGYTRRRESAGLEHEVVDREDPIIVWTTPHRSASGTVTMFAGSFEDARAIEDVIASGEVLMFRQPTFAGMDMFCFGKSSDLAPRRWDTVPPRWSVDLTYRVVRRPTGPLLAAAGWSYDTAAASFTSYDDMAASFTSYDDLAVGP